MIYQNSIISFNKVDLVKKRSLERVLWIAPDRSQVVLINIDDKKKVPFPHFRQYNDLLTQLEDKAVTIESVDPDLRLIVPDELYLSKYSKRRDEKFAIIESIVSKEPDIYIRELRGKLVKEAAETFNKEPNWVYTLLRKYWFYGKNINGLLNDYHDVGVPSQQRRRSKNSGPKPKDGNDFVVTSEEKEIFKKALKEYHADLGMNLKATHKHMCQDYYPDGHYRKYGELIPIAGGPSYRQFLYWYHSEHNKKKKAVAKFGVRKAEMSSRSLLKSVSSDVQGVGEYYEIDSTPADGLLLSIDHKTEIGRPHVYFVKDVESRLITGMHVCKNPSWEEAMVALENASTDKVVFCAQHGIPISEEDWPAKHLPRYIVGDRGEMKSRNSNNLGILNVRIGNPPSYRADLKPYIEQQFRGFCMRIKEIMLGGVHKEHRERGDRNPGDKAVFTFQAFTQLVILFVLEFNKKALSEEYLVTKEKFIDNVELTPLAIWNWGMKKNLLQEQPRALIRHALLPKEKCRVTRTGVMLKKMGYASQRGEDSGWFEDEQIEGEKEVTVSYDPRNCSSVFIKLKDGKEEQLFLTEKFKEYEGLHFDDVKTIMDYKKNQLKKANKERNQIEGELDAVAKKLNLIGLIKTKDAQKGKPKSSRYKNKRIKRKFEKRSESSANAWTATTTFSNNSTSPVASVRKESPQNKQMPQLNKMQMFLLTQSKEKESNHGQ
ncbi:transposase [Paenibacillus sp. RS8]|uniref:Mu transposase C-terminal domain-containing protein n=1 Tax=unclassified Paenibacillus TaxID=185978 RepID=UPI0006949618|nr:Mu transposase C-terminal domain-containing protein [Paenibacillus sp. FSL R5-0345]